MGKLTRAKIREMMRDELKGAREYKYYGLDNLASDEEGHYRYLSKLLEEC